MPSCHLSEKFVADIDDASSMVSHLTSAFEHEAAFTIQRSFRDYQWSKRKARGAGMPEPMAVSMSTPWRALTLIAFCVLIAGSLMGTPRAWGPALFPQPTPMPTPTQHGQTSRPPTPLPKMPPTPPSQIPKAPMLGPLEPLTEVVKGFLGGAASGATAGGFVGLWFPMAMPIEVAFGGVVGGVLGAVQCLIAQV